MNVDELIVDLHVNPPTDRYVAQHVEFPAPNMLVVSDGASAIRIHTTSLGDMESFIEQVRGQFFAAAYPPLSVLREDAIDDILEAPLDPPTSRFASRLPWVEREYHGDEDEDGRLVIFDVPESYRQTLTALHAHLRNIGIVDFRLDQLMDGMRVDVEYLDLLMRETSRANPVMRRGAERFIQYLADCGVLDELRDDYGLDLLWDPR